MKIDKKYKILLICLLIIFLPIIVMADEELSVPQYTEKYKKWLELSEEERKNYIEPQMFQTVEDEITDKIQPFSLEADMNELQTTSLPPTCTRQYDLEVKDQGSANVCWNYSATTVFDTNYYITNKTKKHFSNMHMEYITSYHYNKNGFWRNINSGGNIQIALAYATNGMGIALESDMPTTNITSENLKKVQAKAKVEDYVVLSNQNEIKNYIYNYGVVSATTYINGSQYFSSDRLYSNDDLAYCCDDSSKFVNHAITLVGWNDNYTNSSFPGKKGAYIVLNSYGKYFGNNGIYYIFYDDVFLNDNSFLFGVVKTKDIDYDYLYQHDPYGWTAECGYGLGTYAANVFTRQNIDGAETLKSISAYIPKAGNITIYINANGNDVKTSSATTIINRYIDSPGYHTIQMDSPITLANNQFVVGIKFPGRIGAEIPTSYGWCSTATSKLGESYISSDGKNYKDLQTVYAAYGFKYANACIKAFTDKDYSDSYYTINLNKNISEAGNVSGSGTVKNGNNVTVTAKPNAGYRLVGWYNGNTVLSNNTSYTFKVSKNLNLTAKFEYYGDISNYVFDYKYYADHNLDLYNAFGYNEKALRNHWNACGKAEGRQASPIFDVKYYLENNGDLKSAFGNNYVVAYNHFMNCGFAEYRKSSLEYDGNFYRKNNGDLKNMTSMELIRHYALYGKNELRQANITYNVTSFLLDISVYAELNEDVAKVCGYNEDNLRNHWYRYGISEGRIASLVFDPKYYLKENKDIANAFGSKNYAAAYNHFVNYGFSEGRQGSKVFSVKYYLNKNGDLKSAFGSNYLKVLNHFITIGKKEPRITSPNFSVTVYRQKNGDLLNAYKKNYDRYFIHYLKFGQNEKRVCI